MSIREDQALLAKWWFYGLVLLIATIGVLTVVGWGLHIGGVAVEREVFEQSYQRSEAHKAEIATYEAQLAELDIQLADPDLDAHTRKNLQAQKSAITVRLNAAKATE